MFLSQLDACHILLYDKSIFPFSYIYPLTIFINAVILLLEYNSLRI